MICYTVIPYVDGQHGKSFHILLDDLDDIEQFCEILEGSDEVQYYEIYAHEQLYRDGSGKWEETNYEEL